MKKGLLLLALVILLTGCEQDSLTTKAVKYFNEKEIAFDKEWEYCLIIPGGGCSGCIASGTSFVREMQDFFSKNQNKNVVVFTSTISNKVLKRDLQGVALDSMNVILDMDNIYTINTPDSKYPIILYLNQGKITRAEKQSPETTALEELKYRLNESH